MCAHLLCTHYLHWCLHSFLHIQNLPTHPIQNESLSLSSRYSHATRYTLQIFSELDELLWTWSFFFFFSEGGGVSCVTSPADVSKHEPWLNYALKCGSCLSKQYNFFTHFSQVGIVSKLTMQPVIFSRFSAPFSKVPLRW